MAQYPNSQGELIRTARGSRSQSEFAKLVGCDRSCLSRYEHETLGAPTSVINYCLRSLQEGAAREGGVTSPIQDALAHAREAVAALERFQTAQAPARVGRTK